MMGDDSRRVRLGSLLVGRELGRICNLPGGRGTRASRDEKEGEGEGRRGGRWGNVMEEMYRPYLPRTHNKRNPPQNVEKENEEQRGTI